MLKITSLTLFTFITTFVFAQSTALKVQKIVLENGFTVFLNQDNTAKEVFGAVVVKAGSKNDPADATGMAHYLEHLLFKGTDVLGTTNYELEKPFLDSVVYYYDLLGKTKEDSTRKKIQLLINNQSVQASKYGLPTEFDKLIKSIGGTGLNAFTQNDMTVYHNAFPGEQIEKWLELYSHRFIHPVFRSFQSELEVVYEEKNRGMDNFQMKIIEEMNKHLFQFHPYGTQSTIGTVEHLKNPSLTKMYQYFNTHYVANNMALVLTGNFDADKTLPIIKEKFSKLKRAEVPVFPKYPETIFTKKEVMEVNWTPIKLALVGFKTVPNVHQDNAALNVFSSLLFNESGTGRLNKLQRDGKIMMGMGMDYSFNDDGALMLIIIPKLIGQSIDNAEKLVFAEIEKIKNGEISDTALQIIKTEIYRQSQLELENYQERTFGIVQAFGEGSTWEERLNYVNKINAITKDDVVNVAKKYFNDNYFAIHSKMGFPKKESIQKPGFKPVVTDQKEESSFAKKFNNIIINNATPKFLDIEKDAEVSRINESTKLYVTKNTINDIFTLRIQFAVGSDSLKNLDFASELFSYFHTKDLSTDKLKERFAMLGITSYASCDNNRFTIGFDGLEKNIDKALPLINEIINSSIVEEKVIKNIIDDELSGRETEVKTPDEMGNALYEFVKLGNKSSYIDRLTKKELKKLTTTELLAVYKKAISYNTVIHYVGTTSINDISQKITSNILLANNKKSTPLSVKTNNPQTENKVVVINDSKAVQSQIHFLINSNEYKHNALLDARINAFNKYMGGDFSGLIMQEIREFRSLAYTASGRFVKPIIQNHTSYFNGYVGCQADKTIDAIETMNTLLTNMPQKPERIVEIKSLLKNSTSAYYPEFRNVSTTIENLFQRGYISNPLKDEFTKYDGLSFDDIVSFYEENIKHKPIIITIYGNKSKFDISKLAKFGKVEELKLKDITKQ